MKLLYFLIFVPAVVLCSEAPPPEPQPSTQSSTSSSSTSTPLIPTSTNATTTSSTTNTTPSSESTTTPTAPPSPTTTVTTTTTTTTTKSTTTTIHPTNGTVPTTQRPSTTTPTSNSTTTQPPSPPPVPKPTAGTWMVKNGTSNVTCIIVSMAIQVSVNYSRTDNKTDPAILDVPANATVNGTCGSDKQALRLEWLHESNKSYTNVLEMMFEKNTTQKKFVLQHINLMLAIDPDDFPNFSKNISNITLFHNQTLFPTPLARSYKCMKIQEVSLFSNANSSKPMGTLTVSHVQLEAFHETKSADFSASEDCERSTDIVPITVGCALVGLVAVVLIGYLVGRRRSQARGYLSM